MKVINRKLFFKAILFLSNIIMANFSVFSQSKYKVFKKENYQTLFLKTYSYNLDNPRIVKYTIWTQSGLENSYFELVNKQYRFLYFEYFDGLLPFRFTPENLHKDTIIPNLNFSNIYFWSAEGKLLKSQLLFDTVHTSHFITPSISMYKPKISELTYRHKKISMYFVPNYDETTKLDRRNSSNSFNPDSTGFYILDFKEINFNSIDLDSIFLEKHFFIDTNEYISLRIKNNIIDTLKFNDRNEIFLNSKVYLHKPIMDNVLWIPYAEVNLGIMSVFEKNKKLERIQKRKAKNDKIHSLPKENFAK